MTVARWVLAGSLAIVLYTYLGYPLLCWARARLAPRPVARSVATPTVSVLVAAWRERSTIAAKLASIAAQRYPGAPLDVVLVCDGSDDGTAEEARRAAIGLPFLRLRVVELPVRAGKPTALNVAASHARGEILVFTDARQRIGPGSVAALVADLGDARVGVVGGQLVLSGDAPVGAYWRYESRIRQWEGAHGSTVGVSGALYAMRRALWKPLPADTILDDLLVPARARLAGLRVAYQAAAQAFDRAAPSSREFGRKVRTLAGNFQLILIEPALLVPWRNPAWLDFISHKLLRLLVPWLLLAVLAASVALALGRPAMWLLVGVELCVPALLGLRGLGLLGGSRLAGLAETFVVLNAAAVMALVRFLRDGRRLAW